MEKTKVTKDAENKTLTIERMFDAPKEKLWRAYADKDWFAQWWGPEGWETTVKAFEFTPGGRIHYGMKCIDQTQGEFYGQESWGVMEIETIDAPDSLTVMDYFADAAGAINPDMPAQKLTVTFEDENGRTRLISRSFYDTAEQLEELLQMGMAEGFASSADKLEKLVAG